jgi:hypothetical protein
MTGLMRRSRARVGLAAATIALAAALGGCAQSSNTTSTGAAGGAPPTSSTPTNPTTPTPTNPTTPTTTSATTSVPATGSGTLTASPASGSTESALPSPSTPPANASLSVMGPQKAGCVGIHQQPLPSLPAGQQTSVSLGPAQLGGKWCPGTYSARVEIVARPKCGQGMMCPQFIRVVATLGPAIFRISG